MGWGGEATIFHIHRFDVHEFTDPEAGQLPPVTGQFDAPEWQTI